MEKIGPAGKIENMARQKMIGYHLDDENHWVAELACGHFQHVRHEPPWMVRLWVLTEQGRESMLGYELDCKKCDRGDPKDQSDLS